MQRLEVNGVVRPLLGVVRRQRVKTAASLNQETKKKNLKMNTSI